MNRAQHRRDPGLTAVAIASDLDDPAINAHLGLELIVRDLGRALTAELTMLGVPDRSGGGLLTLARWGATTEPHPSQRSPTGGFAARAARFGLPTIESIAPDDTSLGRPDSGATLTHAGGAAIRSPEGPVGVLCAGFASGPPPDRARLTWLLDGYASLASLCLDQPDALDRLLAGGRIDGLTGCVTQSAFMHELDRELRRADRHGASVSCCFFDLDGFKRVNDRYGHIHGSRVLATVAATLSAAVRTEDTLGRYGGDEFVLLLPDTDEASAAALARRLRAAIAATGFDQPTDPIDVSIGVAQWQPGTGGPELLESADVALRAAKVAGGATVLRASRLKRSSPEPRAPSELRVSALDELPWVRFCGHCGHRPDGERVPRVCVKCGLGVLISAPADRAPEGGEPFLILSDTMRVAAVSKHAQALLGISESWALDRHIDEFMTPADPRIAERDAIATTLARSGAYKTAKELRVGLRTIGGATVPFTVRSGPCGPPRATLVVMTELG